MSTSELPRSLDTITGDAVHFGVKVAEINEGDAVCVFTHDRRRALAAAARHARLTRDEKAVELTASEAAWVQITGPGKEWWAEPCAAEAVNAIPVTVVAWDFAWSRPLAV
ncbi:hypothetical protein [Amycolatopsis orientalis]|uniref:hypothetical protein n=1 Tax=Amycolatopsis orientalis TaxID=31958 RepID=UPI00040E4D21|nr:hypothetical protein [Amycolatopsis orientalis]